MARTLSTAPGMKTKLRTRTSVMAARVFHLKAAWVTYRHHRVKFCTCVLRLRSDAGEDAEACTVAAAATRARSACGSEYRGRASRNRDDSASSSSKCSLQLEQTARCARKSSSFWPVNALSR